MTAERRAVSSSRGCATSGLLPEVQIGRCADKLADYDARKRTAPHGLSGCAHRARFLSGQVVATMVDLDQIPPTIIG